MKICMCRDFDEASLHKAIKEHSPEHPEDVHRIIKNQDPNCGTCLANIQSVMDRHDKTGEIPRFLDIGRDEIEASSKKLADRFREESASIENRRDIPVFKRRYIISDNPAQKN